MKFIKTNPKSIVNIWNDGAQTIVLNVNVEGKMHGIAKGLMNYDLEAASEYMRLCARREVIVGTPVIIRSNKHRGQQYVLCPIKARSGDAPRRNALDLCLKAIRANAITWDIQSIATHPMGCGSSDVYLSWRDTVYPMYRYYLGDAPISITVYGASDPTPAPVVVEEEPVTVVTPVVDAVVITEMIDTFLNDPNAEYSCTLYQSPSWIL